MPANVDKRSFINAKRSQIHEQRHLRKQQIGHYKTEIAMNSHLRKMLDRMVATLGSRGSQPAESLVMQALVQLTTEDHSDAPEPPPGTPGYAAMMASLVDSIKKEIDEEGKATTEGRWDAFVDKLKAHREKLARQTADTANKLDALEKEEKAKITSDDVHEGFSVGHVNKAQDHGRPAPKKTSTRKVQAVEQLNSPSASASPSSLQQPLGDQSSSGADADVEDIEDDADDEHIEPTALGRKFAQIKIGEYRQCLQFISENPDVVAEKETDGLLIDAFNAQMAGRDAYARQCVHQALLLQYCRQLGRDGVSLFFKR